MRHRADDVPSPDNPPLAGWPVWHQQPAALPRPARNHIKSLGLPGVSATSQTNYLVIRAKSSMMLGRLVEWGRAGLRCLYWV